MGMTISNLLQYFLGKEEVRILMIGLDAAGKTTILFKLKVGEVITTIPTIGFNVETLEYKNIRFTVWDIGGQFAIRSLWHHYYVNTGAVIFVVDSSDRERISEAAEELHILLEKDQLRNAVLLVLANKIDLTDAMSITEVTDRMELHRIKQDWHVHATCATSGTGLFDGLEHMREMLNKRKRRKDLRQ